MATKRETKKANTDSILRRATERINLRMATGELRGNSVLARNRLGQVERITQFSNNQLQARQQLNRALSAYGRSGLSSILLRYYAPTVAQYSTLQRTLRLRRRRVAQPTEDFATEDFTPSFSDSTRSNTLAATPTTQYEFFDAAEITPPPPAEMVQRIVQRSENTTASNQFANRVAERSLQKATVARSANFSPTIVRGLDTTVQRQFENSQPTSNNQTLANNSVLQPTHLEAATQATARTNSSNTQSFNQASAEPSAQNSASIARNITNNSEPQSLGSNVAQTVSTNTTYAAPNNNSTQAANYTNNAAIERETVTNFNPEQPTPLRTALQRLDTDFVAANQPEIAPALLLSHRLNRLAASNSNAANSQRISESASFVEPSAVQRQLNNATNQAAQGQVETPRTVAVQRQATANPNTVNSNAGNSNTANFSTTNSNSANVNTTSSANSIQNSQAATAPLNVQERVAQFTSFSDSPMTRAVSRSSTQPADNTSSGWVNRLPIIQQTIGNAPELTAPIVEPENYAAEVRRSYLERQSPATPTTTSVTSSNAPIAQIFATPNTTSNATSNAPITQNSFQQNFATPNTTSANATNITNLQPTIQSSAAIASSTQTNLPLAQNSATNASSTSANLPAFQNPANTDNQVAAATVNSAVQNFSGAARTPQADTNIERITALNVASESPMRRAVQRLNSDFVEASAETVPAMLLSHRLNKMLPATQGQVLVSNSQTNSDAASANTIASANTQAVQRRVDAQLSAPTINSSNLRTTPSVISPNLGSQASTFVSNSNTSLNAMPASANAQDFAATEANAPLNLVQRRANTTSPITNSTATASSASEVARQQAASATLQASYSPLQTSVSNEIARQQAAPAMLRAMERTNLNPSILTTTAATQWASSLPLMQQLTVSEPVSTNAAQPVVSAPETYGESPRRSLNRLVNSVQAEPIVERTLGNAANSASSAQTASTAGQNFVGSVTISGQREFSDALTPIQRAFARTQPEQAISTTQQAVQQILAQPNQAARIAADNASASTSTNITSSNNVVMKAEPNSTLAAAFERGKENYAPTPLMQSLQRMSDQQPNAINNQQQPPNFSYTTPPLLLDMASSSYQPPKAQPTVIQTASNEGFVAGQALPPLASQSVPSTPAIFSKPVSPMTNAENSVSNNISAKTQNAQAVPQVQRTLGQATTQNANADQPQRIETAQDDLGAVVLPSRFERSKIDPTSKLLSDSNEPLAMSQLNLSQPETNSSDTINRKLEDSVPEIKNQDTNYSNRMLDNQAHSVNRQIEPTVINRTLGQFVNPETSPTSTEASPLPMAQLKTNLNSSEVQQNISRLLDRQAELAEQEAATPKAEPNTLNRTLGQTINPESNQVAATPAPLPMPQLKPSADLNDMSEDVLLRAIQNLGKSRPEIMRKAMPTITSNKVASDPSRILSDSNAVAVTTAQNATPSFDPATFASNVPPSPTIAPRFMPAVAVENQVLPLTMVQRKSNGTTANLTNAIGVIGTPTVPTIMRASGGQPLPGAIQRKMSETFGAKFDHVRVHTDNQAVTSAQQMGAEAYTVGSNIFFNSGRYQPDSASGQALIAHELTHVVQQAHLPSLGDGRVLETSTHGQNLEREAIQNEKLMLHHLTTSQASERTRAAGETSLSVNPPASTPTVARSFSPNEIARMVQSGQLQSQGTPTSHSQTSSQPQTVQRIVNSAPTSVEASSTVERIVGKPTEATEQKGKQEIELADEEVERLANKIYRMLRERITLDRERHGVRGSIFH